MQEALFNDPDYEKRIVVRVGRDGADHIVKAVEGEGHRMALSGKSLIIERVTLEKVA